MKDNFNYKKFSKNCKTNLENLKKCRIKLEKLLEDLKKLNKDLIKKNISGNDVYLN